MGPGRQRDDNSVAVAPHVQLSGARFGVREQLSATWIFLTSSCAVSGRFSSFLIIVWFRMTSVNTFLLVSAAAEKSEEAV